ncbi:MAG: peptide chain release factor N(5)-glutamine methyltransferase [Sulfuritalea sp.]|nr:peptide chain release factor N(5)-glutamine methyltransferase [Sulfuritalea sp.]
MTTIAAALEAARPKLGAGEARLLLGHVLDRPAAWLFAHDDESLDENALLSFASLVARRAAGEPVAYLLGQREFFGRVFAVSRAVLIPRPETELLVELVLQKVGDGDTGVESPRILDLGTGSGCIAITLALERPVLNVTAVDASESALAVAEGNAKQLGARLRWLKSDWFSALEGEVFDLIVANPPYIAATDPHLSSGDLRHEPVEALASGVDGLDALRHIIVEASKHLAPHGRILVEHGYDQAGAAHDLLKRSGFVELEQHLDLAGIVRVSGGRAA